MLVGFYLSLPVLVAEIFSVPRNSAELLAITAQNLRVECVLSAAAVT